MIVNDLHLFKISHNGYSINGPHVDIRGSLLHEALDSQNPFALAFAVPSHGESGAHHFRHVQAPLFDGLHEGAVLEGQLQGLALLRHRQGGEPVSTVDVVGDNLGGS